MNGILELSGMTFHAFHGCFEKERIEGNTFIVDFRAELDMEKASLSDDLCDTVNYGEIYDIVKREMDIPSNLLENVAGRILRAIEARFPEIPEFSIKVTKMNPPVEGPAKTSSVTLFHKSAE